MKTYVPKEGEFERGWKVFDAEGKILGRLATEVADTLRGKNKPNFTPHVDTGDFVVIVNADKIRLTGKKLTDKVYYHHTGYPGGIKSITAEKLLEKKPGQLIVEAVKGMLPKNKLQQRFMKKLKVYAGVEHPHQAQKPETATV
ncbi:MAG: 50S ribosomal protein L13 [Proteobacteria bacterium]|nr:50S ribosomal protein L13 [Pseudomonadota bacterium]